MDKHHRVAGAGAFVRIGGVKYRLAPLPADQPSDVDDNEAAGGDTAAGGEAPVPADNTDGGVAQQQLQTQQQMLELMMGEGINVNVKNLDTQARFGP